MSDSSETYDIKEKLKNIPEVLEMIQDLEKTVKKQRKTIKKLKSKLKKKDKTLNKSTQTGDDCSYESKSLVDDIKEAAADAMKSTGFVYEETSGLYYDYNTGYYYNAEYGLYYDGNSGTYMTYNQDTRTYEFHSQIDIKHNEDLDKRKPKLENEQEAKRARFVNDGDDVDSELEEGECSDDSENETNLIVNVNDESMIPCMRIVVDETQVPNLKIGSLYVITMEGGTVGREGDHSILIKDINISKHHLKFDYVKETGIYMAIDLGSRNGTLLNGKRMSPSKQESEPMEIVHGSRVELGTTILLCHIHTSNQTCGHCEPGLIQKDSKSSTSESYDKIKRHKTELKQLRKKFGLSNWDASNANVPDGYTDRAQARRETVGSLNHNEKTEIASVDESIASTNKGFKLLSKMGWNQGDALGKNNVGLLEPIKQIANVGTTGLGLEKISQQVSVNQSSKHKQENWSKAQERYQKIVTNETETNLSDSD